MSTQFGGYMGKVLQIDLSSQQVSEYPWSDEDRQTYLGGKIMAARILADFLKPGMDPLGEENVVVVSTGPLTGTSAPSSSRFNISTLSPLTNLLISSNCGGSFGMHLKKSGFDALILRGKAAEKTWIKIIDGEVSFHNADELWGLTTGETQEAMGGGRAGKLVIGPAGENQVRYACVFSGERTAGRGGIGAVLGAKNLKGVMASGKNRVEVKNKEGMKKTVQGWNKLLKGHPLTGEALPKYGSAYLLRLMQRNGTLATHNFKRGRFDAFDKVSGQTLAETRLIKNMGCPSCTVQCSRQVEIDGKRVKGPELETLGLLGPNLEVSDLDAILRWNYELDELGMDTISTGGVLGFAMELNEQGLWDNGLTFGKTENISAIFKDIAHRRGIGDLLAEGTKRLAEQFGGKDFAINAKGLELSAYEPRRAVGLGLGYATANRGGCHLNGGYIILLEGFALHMNPQTPMAKATLCIINQNLMEAVSSGGNCLFPLFSAVPGWLVRHPDNIITKIANFVLPYTGFTVTLVNKLPGFLLPLHLPMLPHTKAIAQVTGMKMNLGRMKDIGERGFTLERLINLNLGMTGEADKLPRRLTEVPQDPGKPKTRVPLESMKKAYYRIRGWSKEGVPTPATLKRLRLSELQERLVSTE